MNMGFISYKFRGCGWHVVQILDIIILKKKGRHKHDRSVNEHALFGGLSSSDVVQIESIVGVHHTG